MNEILKLSHGFYLQNKFLVLGTIFFGIACSTIESIVIPNTVAGTFNSLGNNIDPKNNPAFRSQLIKLIFSWMVIKMFYAILNYFRKKVEPAITQYITVELIRMVFKKYEIENEITNAAILINKVTVIKKNLQDLFYIFCSVFIPRIIVIFLSCLNFYMINKKLGLIIFVCIVVLGLVVSNGLSSCINMTIEEQSNKDDVYDYIEDIFYNINTLQSTPNAFDNEMIELQNITMFSKEREEKSYECINSKQYQGYATNILIFAIIIYNIYTMYTKGILPKELVTKTLLSLTGLFENIYEMTYYIPEISYKLGILKNNENFLKELKLKNENVLLNDFIFKNSIVEFKNVTFHYKNTNDNKNHILLKDFSIKFPENRIICLFGPSGSGKSSFIRLIFGSEKPNNGSILIGGNDISKFSLNSFRKYISYINQNTTNLFNKSVLNNILYGYYTKSEIEENQDELTDKVKHVFEYFKFYEIFENLDENKSKWSFLYESVGKLGQKLSGGQKQIIHLIRIMFNKYSQIIILDEPTSALDEKSRNCVLNYVKYLRENGKTIFIITHDSFYKDICYSSLQFFQIKNPEFLI